MKAKDDFTDAKETAGWKRSFDAERKKMRRANLVGWRCGYEAREGLVPTLSSLSFSLNLFVLSEDEMGEFLYASEVIIAAERSKASLQGSIWYAEPYRYNDVGCQIFF